MFNESCIDEDGTVDLKNIAAQQPSFDQLARRPTPPKLVGDVVSRAAEQSSHRPPEHTTNSSCAFRPATRRYSVVCHSPLAHKVPLPIFALPGAAATGPCARYAQRLKPGIGAHFFDDM